MPTIKKKNEETMVQVKNRPGLELNVITHLMGKEEVFKMMALAHAAKLPLLLIGEPGVNLK